VWFVIPLYVAFWLAALFGYLGGDHPTVLQALAVIVPALVLGTVANSWWAVLANLVFLVAVPLPERSTIDGSGVDVTLTGLYDVTLGDALELIALTTPWIVLGVLTRRRAGARSAVEAEGAG
jgi:hypothetical protein